ncbi:hypothetical protein D9M70_513310 [compost metagenome]
MLGEVQQLIAGQRPVGALGEGLQKVELHGGEGDFLARCVEQLAALQIEAAEAELQAGAGGFRFRRDGAGRRAAVAPQHGLDPRQQLAGVEWLGQVVVGTHFQADDAVQRRAGAGDHDHRQVVMFAEIARQAEAVLAGQADVQQHQVGQRLGEPRPQLDAVSHGVDLVTLAAEVVQQQFADRLVVVHDQDADQFGHGPVPLASF